MFTRALKISMIIGVSVIMLMSAGCGPCARLFHKTAISYFPHKKSALSPPEPVPHFAEPNFFGYYGTCWHEWPEGWVECPCDIVYEETIPGQELEEVPYDSPSEERNGMPDDAVPMDEMEPTPSLPMDAPTVVPDTDEETMTEEPDPANSLESEPTVAPPDEQNTIEPEEQDATEPEVPNDTDVESQNPTESDEQEATEQDEQATEQDEQSPTPSDEFNPQSMREPSGRATPVKHRVLPAYQPARPASADQKKSERQIKPVESVRVPSGRAVQSNRVRQRVTDDHSTPESVELKPELVKPELVKPAKFESEPQELLPPDLSELAF